MYQQGNFFSQRGRHDVKLYFYILTKTRSFDIIMTKNEFKFNNPHMRQDFMQADKTLAKTSITKRLTKTKKTANTQR
jgi:tRNA pseudouridine-54 N-methylase